jgi:hypothetical protein
LLDEPTNWSNLEVERFINDPRDLEHDVRRGRFGDLPNPLVPLRRAMPNNDRRQNAVDEFDPHKGRGKGRRRHGRK